jgi:hypothetical protein
MQGVEMVMMISSIQGGQVESDDMADRLVDLLNLKPQTHDAYRKLVTQSKCVQEKGKDTTT